MNLRFGSVCSGIEAASVAWNPLGWSAAWLSEIDNFPSAVLAFHYPNVKNLGDMTQIPKLILERKIEAPEILAGGTPCQAFSIAGSRQSLSDSRGNLSLIFVEIFHAIRTVRLEYGQSEPILFWENVPGVLNTKDNAFGCFLSGIVREDIFTPKNNKWPAAGMVSGEKIEAAWRVLNAEYFGLAQRRKRVYLIASARKGHGGGGLPSRVLFESPCVHGHTETCNEEGDKAPAFTSTSFGQYKQSKFSGNLRSSGGDLSGGSETLVIENRPFARSGFGQYLESNKSNTLQTGKSELHGGSETLIVQSAFTERDSHCSDYREDVKTPTLRGANGIARGNSEVLILEGKND